mmetsp:Transcript_35762/g.94009  ORF Transcript_35762/g.94009 Transcript_35762/m.94009 type:complete len:232 (+) Transcript_35762:1-696(+)
MTLGEHSSFSTLLTLVCIIPAMGRTKMGDSMDYYSFGAMIGQRMINNFLEVLSDAEFFRAHVFMMEYQYQNLDRLTLERGNGDLVKTFTVFDLSGVTRAHANGKLLRRVQRWLPLLDLYYPEMTRTTCLLNAPGIFFSLYQMIKPFSSRRMRDSLQVLKPGKATATLHKHVDVEQLAGCYGGTIAQLPPETAASLGLDRIEQPRQAGLYPGRQVRMGQIHLPEAQRRAVDE